MYAANVAPICPIVLAENARRHETLPRPLLFAIASVAALAREVPHSLFLEVRRTLDRLIIEHGVLTCSTLINIKIILVLSMSHVSFPSKSAACAVDLNHGVLCRSCMVAQIQKEDLLLGFAPPRYAHAGLGVSCTRRLIAITGDSNVARYRSSSPVSFTLVASHARRKTPCVARLHHCG